MNLGSVLHEERPCNLAQNDSASHQLRRCSPAGCYPPVAVHAVDLLPSLLAHHMAKHIQHWSLCLLPWLVLQNTRHLSAHRQAPKITVAHDISLSSSLFSWW